MEKDEISQAMKLMEDLMKSKRAVLYCLEHADGLCDFHGLVYWAEQVQALREKVRDIL